MNPSYQYYSNDHHDQHDEKLTSTNDHHYSMMCINHEQQVQAQQQQTFDQVLTLTSDANQANLVIDDGQRFDIDSHQHLPMMAPSSTIRPQPLNSLNNHYDCSDNNCSSLSCSPISMVVHNSTNNNTKINTSSASYQRTLQKLQHRRLNEMTLKWLDDNYELRDGICLPRCLIYRHYLQFMQCNAPDSKPVGAAAFGKLVRQKFSKISTRRLGTRGQSKYHYYGISIRQTSPLFHEQTSLVTYQNFGGSPSSLALQDLRYHQPKQNHRNQSLDHSIHDQNYSQNYDPNNYTVSTCDYYNANLQQQPHNPEPYYNTIECSKDYTSNICNTNQFYLANNNPSPVVDPSPLKPEQYHESANDTNNETDSVQIKCEIDQFVWPSTSTPNTAMNYFQNVYPKIEDFEPHRPPEISEAILSTFLLMYRSHCERLFDTFQLANVDEMQRSVVNFWHQMPIHLAPFWSTEFSFQVVKLIDTLLCKTMEDFFSQLSLLPEISDQFIDDIQNIIDNLAKWLRTAIMDPTGQMYSIISQYRYDVLLASGKQLNINHSKLMEMINNQTFEHLYQFSNHKLGIIHRFVVNINEQLRFIRMIKDYKQTMLELQECVVNNCDTQIPFNNYHHSSSINHQLISVLKLKSFNLFIMDQMNIDQMMNEALKNNDDIDHSEHLMNRINDEQSNTGQQLNTSLHCNCLSNQSAKHLLEHFGQQFELLTKHYIQNVSEFDLMQLLHWTKNIVDYYIWKCHWKCIRRRCKLILYEAHFNMNNAFISISSVMNDSKASSLWDLAFVCIKQYLLLNLSRIDYYEMKLQSSIDTSLVDDNLHDSPLVQNNEQIIDTIKSIQTITPPPPMMINDSMNHRNCKNSSLSSQSPCDWTVYNNNNNSDTSSSTTTTTMANEMMTESNNSPCFIADITTDQNCNQNDTNNSNVAMNYMAESNGNIYACLN